MDIEPRGNLRMKLRILTALALALSAPLLAAPGCAAKVYDPFGLAQNPEGKPTGAACAFDSQCETGRCSADVDAGTCGECVTISALGQSCAGAHQGCSTSAICKDGICQSLRKTEGETCAFGPKGEDSDDCDVELYCAHGDEYLDPGTCTRRVAVGESCEDGQRCVTGALCEGGECIIPAAGTCNGARPWCGAASYCGDDLQCHPGTLTEGDPCDLVDGEFIKNECVAGLVCGNLDYPNGGGGYGTPRTCVPLPGKGEPCVNSVCGEGLFCLRSTDGLSLPICDTPRSEGEACRNDNYYNIACAEGLECRASVCRAACE